MSKIVHYVHTSLDGFIEGPNGEFDWPMMGPELSAYSFGLHDRARTFLYGRRVWDMMAGYWPDVESISDDAHDLAFAPIWREAAKIVVSTTVDSAGWNTTVVRTVDELAKLKDRAGSDLLLTGGAGLADALTEAGLIDEYHAVVHPVLLGGGKRLFAEGRARRPLRLVETRMLDNRTVLSVHALTES
ncbi:deaminase [Kribbella sp. ALI-6-A]|uniref:dihydrofolate reductase family protein n=1 Tax=Kribbella sp. ALI-6-A TaxID=1933817 RepID=UPI00097C9016|nr:dihydrofolate reductase family protein [Kribbella sp. ALI-6-A]ONI68429.1 deaminase [Kribbella sp. ALI-6-A]